MPALHTKCRSRLMKSKIRIDEMNGVVRQSGKEDLHGERERKSKAVITKL